MMSNLAGQGGCTVFSGCQAKKAPAPEATGAKNARLLTQTKQGADKIHDRRDRSQRTKRFSLPKVVAHLAMSQAA